MSEDARVTARRRSRPDRGDAASAFLIVSMGDVLATRVVRLHDDEPIVVGRNGDCEIVIADNAVSRRHATVVRRGDGVTVTDLDSRSGTVVNGAPIRGSRELVTGDIVAIGPMVAVLAIAGSVRRPRQVATIDELEERLEGEVERAMRYHRPLALVMLRLDGRIAEVAAHVESLVRQVRRMDLVAEYGADEFAIVLPETSQQGARLLAEQRIEARGLAMTTGYATFPEDGASAQELIGVARERLRGPRSHKKRASTNVAVSAMGPRIVVEDPLMKHVYKLTKRVAASAMTVLVTGETGVGKEVVAEVLHRLSPRASAPYVRLNCASLSETLVEDELFGHEKGAFTGAVAAKRGFFEVAHRGTLFLDEIGELPLGTQAKLLRVIEQHKIVRLGGTSEISVDVRLVCATNRDLEAEVERGRFRGDLYFRIGGFVIAVPALRARPGEIPLLATHFARELTAQLGRTIVIGPEAAAALAAYPWPGNVRELRNVIERAAVVCAHGRIELQDLPDKLREGVRRPRSRTGALDVQQRDREREAIAAALAAHDGNQSQAARELGISRFRLMRLIEKHELPRRSK